MSRGNQTIDIIYHEFTDEGMRPMAWRYVTRDTIKEVARSFFEMGGFYNDVEHVWIPYHQIISLRLVQT